MSGAADPTDQPFTYSASPQQSDGLGRWYLDAKNAAYFQRLSTVVSYAAANNMYVEITFFSPQTGAFYLGPWSTAHAYLQNGTKLAGFSDPANFVNTASSQYTAMVPYLFNVVHWTVDTLHTFTNLYYEVANEPENVTLTQPQSPSCSSWGNHSETSPVTVATWQAAIAAEVKRYESATYGLNHLIAVEPLTTTDAAPFMTGGADASSATIVNSHYTAINPLLSTGLSSVGLGAIRLVRQYNNQPRILGFNETKITGGTGCAAPNTVQSVDEGRAEAWEFMVDQGGIYDQFGYDCYAPDYTQTRLEMGMLRTFLSTTVNIGRNMMTSNSTGPSWVNPGPYAAQEPATGSQKFWAAVEPTPPAATKRWLLYVHHSKSRGRIFDGYQEVSTNNVYQESLSVCLGAASGTYLAQWIDPKNAIVNGVVQPLQTPTTIAWTGNSSCKPGGAGAFTLPSPPHYAYDIALLISP
jgi:Cellulase (glycosyl hydrolase family 5)